MKNLVVENAQCVKSIGMGLEEILDGKVHIEFES